MPKEVTEGKLAYFRLHLLLLLIPNEADRFTCAFWMGLPSTVSSFDVAKIPNPGIISHQRTSDYQEAIVISSARNPSLLRYPSIRTSFRQSACRIVVTGLSADLRIAFQFCAIRVRTAGGISDPATLSSEATENIRRDHLLEKTPSIQHQHRKQVRGRQLT